MKLFYQRDIILGSVLLLLSLLGSSCSDDLLGRRGEPLPTPDPAGSEWVRLAIPFDTPDPVEAIDARALSPEGENIFSKENVRVLVFDGRTQRYNNKIEPEVLEVRPRPENDKNSGEIVLKTLTPSTNQIYVVLVNAEGPAEFSTFMQKYQLIPLISYSLPENGEWESGTLPMWGEVSGVTVTEGEGWPAGKTVHLTRAVARVDVGLNISKSSTQFDETADGIPGITLDKVYFYNCASKGRPMPMVDQNGLWLTPWTDSSGSQAPNVARIDRSADINDEGTLLKRGAYLPEAKNPAENGYNPSFTGDVAYYCL